MSGMDEFGRLIRRAMDRQGIEGRELADRIGTSPSYVSDITGGKKKNPPAPHIFRALGKELGLSAEEMLIAVGYLPKEEPDDQRALSRPRQQIINKVDEYHWPADAVDIATSFIDSAARLYARAPKMRSATGYRVEEDDSPEPSRETRINEKEDKQGD